MPGNVTSAQHLACRVVNPDLRVSVLQVIENEFIVDEADRLQRVFTLRHDDFPVVARRLADVDFDNLAARRLQVSLEPEARSLIADEVVSSVEIVKQFDY